jgi:hypothetical protein
MLGPSAAKSLRVMGRANRLVGTSSYGTGNMFAAEEIARAKEILDSSDETDAREILRVKVATDVARQGKVSAQWNSWLQSERRARRFEYVRYLFFLAYL